MQGNRRDVKELGSGSQKVLNEVMYLIDLHDLYGYVAYPKAHSQSDISDIYRFAEVSNGIFVNPALQEPFGLTVIEVPPFSSPFHVLFPKAVFVTSGSSNYDSVLLPSQHLVNWSRR